MEFENPKMSTRILIVLVIFVAASAGLVGRLFYLQIVQHEYYLAQVIRNVSQTTNLPAARGNIYDTNMRPLAINTTTWRVFICPNTIQRDDVLSNLIADNLSQILERDREFVFDLTQRINRRDETVRRNVERDMADAVRAFIERYPEHRLNRIIHLEPTSTRYYPFGALASQVIGAMGTDRGLFGLEFQYNEEMRGTAGRIVRARDGRSRAFPRRYELEISAQDGLSIVTTIDVRIQQALEAQLRATYVTNRARHGVAGIVQDVNTGAILAMGTYPTFNLNTPFNLVGRFAETLANSGHEEGSSAYRALREQLLFQMWQNKNVTDTYEPGSTFKVMTYAMALESIGGTVNSQTPFSCPGFHMPSPGIRVNCHQRNGHGTRSFAAMLQVSCNPATMQIAHRLGRDVFWSHFVNFGFTERTGIDLPGEGTGLFHSHRQLNPVELAVSSFGQTFRTTPLHLVTATSSVANGGWLVRPHVVREMRDSSGNVVVSFDQRPIRQILSAEVCNEIAVILEESVGGSGAARNTFLIGYSISAKTGTSELRDTRPAPGELPYNIGSVVAFAPTHDPQVSVLMLVDRPNVANRRAFGSIVASPYVREVLGAILPILGVERNWGSQEIQLLTARVPNVVGNNVNLATNRLRQDSMQYEIRGEGTTVLRQFPPANTQVFRTNTRVILFTEDLPNDAPRNVPTVTGSSVNHAIQSLQQAGFNVRLVGALNIQAGTGAVVDAQSIAGGTAAAPGTVIELTIIHLDVDDGGELPENAIR